MGFGGAGNKVKTTATKTSNERELLLKEGYHNMSQINLSLAEEALEADNEALFLAEQNLRSVKNK